MSKIEEIKRISFSELKIWKECPFKHKLVYKDKLSHFSGNEYTAFGSAVHTVCEKLILNDEIIGIDLFKESFSKELSLLKEDNVPINEELVKEMNSQAIQICENAIPAVKEHFKNYEVVSVEEQLLENIDEFPSGDLNFKGFIDLVLKTSDGKYHIIDWKTCSWGWGARRKTDPMTTYQLIYYKNYFSKKHKIDPENIETYFALLKRTATKDNVEIFRVSSGKEKLKNSLKLLESAVVNITKENYIKNRLSCRNCKFYKTENCP